MCCLCVFSLFNIHPSICWVCDSMITLSSSLCLSSAGGFYNSLWRTDLQVYSSVVGELQVRNPSSVPCALGLSLAPIGWAACDDITAWNQTDRPSSHFKPACFLILTFCFELEILLVHPKCFFFLLGWVEISFPHFSCSLPSFLHSQKFTVWVCLIFSFWLHGSLSFVPCCTFEFVFMRHQFPVSFSPLIYPACACWI